MSEGTAGDPDGWVARPVPGGGVRIESMPARMLIGHHELDDMMKSGRFGEIVTNVQEAEADQDLRMTVTATNGVWVYELTPADAWVWEARLVERRPVRVPVNRGKP